jgi:hypothetical protein
MAVQDFARRTMNPNENRQNLRETGNVSRQFWLCSEHNCLPQSLQFTMDIDGAYSLDPGLSFVKEV